MLIFFNIFKAALKDIEEGYFSFYNTGNITSIKTIYLHKDKYMKQKATDTNKKLRKTK